MSPPERPILTLDVDLYQSFLDGSDMSAEQKQEFLETLWSIMVQFVDMGFGIHPVQHALNERGLDEACGQNGKNNGAKPSVLISSWDQSNPSKLPAPSQPEGAERKES